MNEIINVMHNLTDSKILIGLVVIVFADYATGVSKSVVWKVPDSSVGFKGLVKHVTVLVLFMIGYIVANLCNAMFIADGLGVMYILNYLLSIMENLGVMGIYVPAFLKTKIEAEIKRYEEQLAQGITSAELKRKESKVEVTVNQSTVLEQLNEAGLIKPDMTVAEVQNLMKQKGE